MGLDGDHLLKRLRPVASPAASSSTRPHAASGSDGVFSRLIRLAESDQLDSQRPVVSAGTQQLSEEQLLKIGRACDSLESAGLDDGLVLLGGRAFVVEVADRSIRQELTDTDAGAIHSLGGVVLVEGVDEASSSAESGPGAPVPPLSANTAFHPDLVTSRAGRQGPAQAS